jgi:hypothetical protein
MHRLQEQMVQFMEWKLKQALQLFLQQQESGGGNQSMLMVRIMI